MQLICAGGGWGQLPPTFGCHQINHVFKYLMYIEFIDSTGLNYVMFAHDSVVLRNQNGNRINPPDKNHPRKNPPEKIPLNAVESEPVNVATKK